MKELTESLNFRKEKKIAISVGLLLFTCSTSVGAVISFYNHFNALGGALFAFSQISFGSAAFFGGGAFWQKSKDFETEKSPLIFNEAERSIVNWAERIRNGNH